jgi:DNA-binding transcriptional regulator/RsmH inhibitor MraZ
MENIAASRRRIETKRQLLGHDEAVIDDKGRLRLPKKMEEALGKPFVLWVNRSGLLSAWSEEEWEWQTARASETNMQSEEDDEMLRALGERAEANIKCDAQGRFVIPSRLREYTGLKEGEVELVGMITHLKIIPKRQAGKA